MEAFLIVLGAIVVIVIACAVATQFKHIAEMKGHDGSHYFWWSLLLGPIGMLMVVALPDRGAPLAAAAERGVQTSAGEADDELPEL